MGRWRIYDSLPSEGGRVPVSTTTFRQRNHRRRRVLCGLWGAGTADTSRGGPMLRLHTSDEDESGRETQHLRQAVSQDDALLLDEMLSQEIYKRVIDRRGGWGVAGTPLRMAASKGHLRCLRVLLAHGASVDRVDVKAQTPLFTAVCGKYLECVLALLQAGADPDGSAANNCSPVLTAAREGDAAILRELLRHGAEVNSRSRVPLWSSGASVSSGPLYLSAVYGHMECFRVLLAYGADPDYNCTDGRLLGRIKQPKTVLEMCLRHGCGVEYVRLLIDFGANVYLPTLIIEKTTKQNEAVELLLRERGTPKSLASQCRLAIRAQLKKADRIHCVDQLGMPQSLINYLEHKTTAAVIL